MHDEIDAAGNPYRSIALLQIGKAINTALRLPEQKFVGKWNKYFLFHSDWMFVGTFVESVKQLLYAEHARVACLLNICDSNMGLSTVI
jgi:hypothetical protein